MRDALRLVGRGVSFCYVLDRLGPRVERDALRRVGRDAVRAATCGSDTPPPPHLRRAVLGCIDIDRSDRQSFLFDLVPSARLEIIKIGHAGNHVIIEQAMRSGNASEERRSVRPARRGIAARPARVRRRYRSRRAGRG